MLLFKRILDFRDPPLTPSDKRHLHRYAVGQPFPFTVSLTLNGRDAQGRSAPTDHGKQDWPGVLINLSPTGACIDLATGPGNAQRGEDCLLTVSLDDYTLAIPARVAHCDLHRAQPHYGLTFDFVDFETEKAYLQLLEPVSIGASLVPADPAQVRQDTPGLIKEEYPGTLHSQLTIWRHGRSQSIHSFDFQMNEYGVRWTDGQTEVEPYGLSRRAESGEKPGPALLALNEDQLDEVRWLFCLAVPNLATTVPEDVRDFLAALVAL